ncbi:MAG: T9SS type A sorting domain-containing protein [Saprospiraceae bacterium]|nr:T9SS type A sorting domain-containing protein [Saprospiraceae bacterium]
MKKSYLILVFFFFIIATSYSQNLISNWSFEKKDSCHYFMAVSCENWYPANSMTPDYYSNCWSTSSFHTDSQNVAGYQKPSTGDSYVGAAFYYIFPNAREYIETSLIDTLESNQMYFVNFKLSLANSSKYAISNVGIAFSDTLINVNYAIPFSDKTLYLNPQISNSSTNYLSDTSEWMVIQGSFIANGTEKYLVIGNFNNDTNTNKIIVNNTSLPNGYGNNGAYYLIDDVIVRRADTVHYAANAGANRYICYGDSVRIGSHDYSDYTYSWLPASGLSFYEPGKPYAKPDTTTTYILSVTDNWAYQTLDTITVFVDCLPAMAGKDTTICKGDSINLGKFNLAYMQYQWQPNIWLTDSTSGTPYAKPDSNITYVVFQTDSNSVLKTDTINITVVNCFYPNAGADTTICLGDSVVIGTYNNPNYQYLWQPSTFLLDSTSGLTYTKPDSTITYILEQWDSLNIHLTDTITISVAQCYFANCGNDTSIWLGDSIQIGTHNFSFVQYLWSPNFNISDTTIGKPIVFPDTSTFFFLQVTDTMGNISFDSILITVVDSTVGVNQLVINNQELVIYPNPASGFIIIEFNELQHQDCIFELYNNLGRKVMERVLKKGENKYQLSTGKLESGVYFYKLEAGESFNGKIIISK